MRQREKENSLINSTGSEIYIPLLPATCMTKDTDLKQNTFHSRRISFGAADYRDTFYISK